ncbi:hypothetical protein D3C73_1153720 [compost metagenome]
MHQAHFVAGVRDKSSLAGQEEFRQPPAVTLLSDHVLERDPYIVKEDLISVMHTIKCDDRLDGYSRRLHIDQQERNALLFFSAPVGTDQTMHHVCPMRFGGPHLRSVDDVMVTVTHRARVQGSKV